VPCVRHHHERWDGSGYPDGLKGADIPLTARILSIADCFDAVREDRPYRKSMTRQAAIDFMLERSGSQYDPELVGLFLTNLPRFEAQIRAERVFTAQDFGVVPAARIAGGGRPDAGIAT
jgi:HD-GYP domain-containing protein (c-di-GMP phosphodiesterase class II)